MALVGRGSHGGAHVVGVTDALVHDLARRSRAVHLGAVPLPRPAPPPPRRSPSTGRWGCAGRRTPAGCGTAAPRSRSGRRPWRRTTSPKPPSSMHGGQRAGSPPWWSRPRRDRRRGCPAPRTAKGGGDALVQKVPGEDIVQRGGGLLGLVQGVLQRHFLHGALGLFKAGLAKGVVLIDEVKRGGQRPFPLLFAHHVGVAGDGGRGCKGHGLACPVFSWSWYLSYASDWQ